MVLVGYSRGLVHILERRTVGARLLREHSDKKCECVLLHVDYIVVLFLACETIPSSMANLYISSSRDSISILKRSLLINALL